MQGAQTLAMTAEISTLATRPIIGQLGMLYSVVQPVGPIGAYESPHEAKSHILTRKMYAIAVATHHKFELPEIPRGSLERRARFFDDVFRNVLCHQVRQVVDEEFLAMAGSNNIIDSFDRRGLYFNLIPDFALAGLVSFDPAVKVIDTATRKIFAIGVESAGRVEEEKGRINIFYNPWMLFVRGGTYVALGIRIALTGEPDASWIPISILGCEAFAFAVNWGLNRKPREELAKERAVLTAVIEAHEKYSTFKEKLMESKEAIRARAREINEVVAN